MTAPLAKGRTLYVSDLDGTLLGADSRLSARSASLLNEAMSRGTLFSVATARTPATVSVLLQGLAKPLPYIVMTGSLIWDGAADRYLHSETMEGDTARRVYSSLRADGVPFFMFRILDGMIHIWHSGPLSDLERKFIAERKDSPFKTFHVPESGESLFPEDMGSTSLFYAMQPSGRVEGAYGHLSGMDDINPIFYHDIYGPDAGILEVFGRKASKAEALARLKSMCGADRVVAFGDNLNDLPMLRAADVSVAVGNAVDEVKREADIIIGPNTADSVAECIRCMEVTGSV